MAKYLIDSIGHLVRQLAYTPAETLTLQVASGEDLLHEVDSSRAYPLDYVVYRITGYQRRFREGKVAGDLLTGIALQHDLGLLIEQLSDRLQLVARDAGEPVLSIDDITEQFNITSKTVQRWRRRGLPSRRFLFADGKRRVGFLLSSVERFILAHREQVIGDHPNISLVEAAERDRMLRTARRLAIEGRCWPDEVARRIGKRFKRSPLTVLHTIRTHDETNTADAIFPLAAKPVSEKAKIRVLRRFRKGWTVTQLAARLDRPRSAVYRIILDERLARLQRRKTRFIDDPLYHQPDAEQVVDAIASQQTLSSAEFETGIVALPRNLSRPLQSICRVPLLTPAGERALFLQFNFHKFQFVQTRRRLDPQFARRRDIAEMERHLANVTAVRNRIVTANLRLVVNIARKHLRPGLSLMELISDGNLTLMRAVDGFDIHRGNRFSTYATLALMKGFARSVSLLRPVAGNANRDPFFLHEVADRRSHESDSATILDEVSVLLGRLSDAERHVINAFYGLRPTESSKFTIRQLAASLGLTPPLVREIERSALAKMRLPASLR